MILFFERRYLFAAIILFCVACSSKNSYSPPTTANQNLSTWDHEQIRKARQAEQEQTPPLSDSEQEDARSNCVVMSQTEMRRAKAQGCIKLDPRAGNGEDSFCCPPAAKK